MIVINVLVTIGIKENIQSVILTYVFTLILSVFSVFVIKKYGVKLCKRFLNFSKEENLCTRKT